MPQGFRFKFREAYIHIRGKLNAHSAALLEGENTLEVTTENSIAIHVPYDPEIDDVEYCCEVVVFC